jgi:aerobic-type carbon monoxide dehydrogenase small subunit (CoxS/CutS family)
MDDDVVTIKATVNGQVIRRSVPVRMNLVDFVRHELGLTGSHVGCEHGVCGACTIVVEGAIVRGCLTFAVQINGKSVETIEGASTSGRLQGLQHAFAECSALQCGFCTPGMLLTAAEFLDRERLPSREAIRVALSGNICRCTGYQAIVDAVEMAAEARAGASDAGESATPTADAQ